MTITITITITKMMENDGFIIGIVSRAGRPGGSAAPRGAQERGPRVGYGRPRERTEPTHLRVFGLGF